MSQTSLYPCVICVSYVSLVELECAAVPHQLPAPCLTTSLCLSPFPQLVSKVLIFLTISRCLSLFPRSVSKVLTFLTGLVGQLVGEALTDAGGGQAGGRHDSE